MVFPPCFPSLHTSRFLLPTTIHRIVELPEGECWTCGVYGPVVQTPGFFRQENGKLEYRDWDKDWSEYV